jgi:hypothetical protein
VQSTIAASIGVVSDSTVGADGAEVVLFHGAAVREVDDTWETVLAPMPDAGVGALCEWEQAGAKSATRRSAHPFQAAWARTFKARLLFMGERPDRGAALPLESNRRRGPPDATSNIALQDRGISARPRKIRVGAVPMLPAPGAASSSTRQEGL